MRSRLLPSVAGRAARGAPLTFNVMFQERTLKYFELMIALACLLLTFFWVKNSPPSEFPYEPVLALFVGIGVFFDSLRRFGIFLKVCLSPQNPVIQPWSFSGGKVDKTDVQVELIIENNKECALLLLSVEIHASISVINSVGKQQNKIRIVDMEKIGNDAFLPMSIPGKSSKTLLIESVYDASNIEKYIQASKIGNLKKVESFELCVTYTIGSKQKIASVYFTVETSQLLEVIRSRYEESGDHKGVVKLLEKT